MSELIAALIAGETADGIVEDLVDDAAAPAPESPAPTEDGGGLGWLVAIVLVLLAGGAGVLVGRTRMSG